MLLPLFTIEKKKCMEYLLERHGQCVLKRNLTIFKLHSTMNHVMIMFIFAFPAIIIGHDMANKLFQK